MLPDPTILELEGLNVALRRAGEGPPILALHGFPQTSACWFPLADRLASRFEILMPDLPGLGASDPLPVTDARHVAKHMVRLLDEVGIEKATVLGHDFGGAIAWSLALHHPDRVARVIVVNSPFRRLDLKRGWHMLFFNLPVIPELAFTLAGARLVRLIIRLASARQGVIEQDAMREYERSLRTLDRQRSAFAYYRTTTRAFLRAALPIPGRRKPSGPTRRVEVPALVVWGMDDPVLPAHLLEGMERSIDDLTVEKLEGVGHFVPEEDPDRLADAIERFVDA